MLPNTIAAINFGAGTPFAKARLRIARGMMRGDG
jgi:hypothetical protein